MLPATISDPYKQQKKVRFALGVGMVASRGLLLLPVLAFVVVVVAVAAIIYASSRMGFNSYGVWAMYELV